MIKTERLEHLNKLIEELVSPNPSEDKIFDLFQVLGLPFEKDPVKRVNLTLKELTDVTDSSFFEEPHAQ